MLKPPLFVFVCVAVGLTVFAENATSRHFASLPSERTRSPLAQALQEECELGAIECAERNGGPLFAWQDTPLPYVVSPRRTQLMAAQPLLRWQSVPDATTYQVSIKHITSRAIIWQTETTATQVQYTGDTPLQPGETYEVTVKTDTGAKSWQETAQEEMNFTMLTTAEQDTVQRLVAERREAQPDPDRLQRELAVLYLQHGLIADAIAQLEHLWQRQPSAALAVELGNLYFAALYLVHPAQDYYEQALDLAGTEPSPTRAIALAQLGHIHAVKRDHANAIAWFEQAQHLEHLLTPEEVATLKTAIAYQQDRLRSQTNP